MTSIWINNNVLHTPFEQIPLEHISYFNSVFRVSNENDLLLADILIGLNEIYITTPQYNMQYSITDSVYEYFMLLSKKHNQTNDKNNN